MLTIPVPRSHFIISKLLLLFLWMMLLTSFAWIVTLFLGFLLRFDGLSPLLLMKSFQQYIVGGGFLFILSTPIILITLVAKNYVPPIIFSIVVTMINVMMASSEHRGLFPWAAVHDIVNGSLDPQYPPSYSYVVIAVTAIAGLTAALVYFKRVDIQ